MKRFALIACLLCCLPVLFAKEYRPEDIPMVHLQNKFHYVSNPDGILSQAAVAAIDTTLYALEQETGIQTLVAVVERIDGNDCFDFAYQLGKRNGVGRKGKDDGLVILLVTGERCIQFVTGYGLEGDLPDALCKRIQSRYMNPSFAKGDWDAGMTAGIAAVRRQLAGTGEPPTPHDEESNPLLLILLLGCCFVVVPALLLLSAWRRNRCPRCHKHTLQQSVHIISRNHAIRVEEVVRRCTHCGYTDHRQRTVEERDNDFTGGMGGGPFIGGPFVGGLFGGGKGGGGFTGGSFGGGSFGGGGAGSRF